MQGRLYTSSPVSSSRTFRSTPPCGGDARRKAGSSFSIKISIHAPMRGRLTNCHDWRTKPYFNPRPHAGATSVLRGKIRERYDFNPRPHAGATEQPGEGCTELRFQSTPPCGGDLLALAICVNPTKFQSTPPCGGDLVCIIDDRNFTDFNPRPHAGATVPVPPP